MIFNRMYKYSSKDTHTCKPIGDLLRRYAENCEVIIDPFARNCLIANYTNDLNPNTLAKWHMQADAFLQKLIDDNIKADFVILDPPYSPRQIAEYYKDLGIPVTMQTTQNAPLYAKVKNLSRQLIKPGGHIITLGWNSMGMGKKNGFETVEILLVCHGGAQNDTICVVDKKVHS